MLVNQTTFSFVGSACKARWYQLRDQWRKNKKTKITKSGQASQQLKKWRYDAEMSFLEPYVRQRDTLSNIDDFSESTIESSLQTDNIHVEDTTETVQDTPALCSNENQSTPVLKKPKTSFNKKTSKVRTQEPSASSELMKYLIKKQETEQILSVPKRDATDIFFESIAAKVKKFTPYHRNIAENRIFDLVQKIELDQILQTQSHSQPATSYSQSFLHQNNNEQPASPMMSTYIPPATPSPSATTSTSLASYISTFNYDEENLC